MKALFIKKVNFLLFAASIFLLGACHQEIKRQQHSDTVIVEEVQYKNSEAAVPQPHISDNGMMVN